ncbi:hypothetical protein BT246_66010 (plasmid) [Bacillus thuringiensis]|uniref:Uncharacterized protein n=1 Tax=Bacillus thuringiensis TaxID=1428 RepID=A0A9W3SI60_BACTU|nr:hypothetical protein BT246_66010 [Bacillus thuringiensis]
MIPYNFNPIRTNVEKIDNPFFGNVNKTPAKNKTTEPIMRKLSNVSTSFLCMLYDRL